MDDPNALILLEVVLLGIFVVLGLKRAWREAVAAFVLLSGFVAYFIWAFPLSSDPAEEVGQQVTRMILFVFLFGCIAAFGLCFAVSGLRTRISQDRAKKAGK